MQNRDTIINRIFYLAYKYRIRNMIFEWDGRLFDPIRLEDQKFLENASLVVLSQILEKYLEARDIIYKEADDIVYWTKYKNHKISSYSHNNYL